MDDLIALIIVISLVIIICDVFFFAIGLNYMHSKVPLGFYTSEKPPKPEEISDVRAWNRKHGIAVFVYGGVMTVSLILTLFMNLTGIIIAIAVGVIGGIIGLILYHHYLVKKYRITPAE